MKTLNLTRRMLFAAAAVAAVVAGSSAVALATTASSNNFYQGCLKASNGSLHQVELNPSTPPTCRPHDTLVSWNQTGPAGATGPQGPKGDAGAPGPQGQTGLKGDTGAPGPQGPRGDTGSAGADGKTVLNGTDAPTGDQGTNGDFYVDTSVSAIYGPKTDAGWGDPTSLVGPQGAKGDPGSPGTPGAQGDTGPQGPQGLKGDAGPQGPTGPTYVANALISAAGAPYFHEVSPGVTFTVTHMAPGRYELTISGLGADLVMPTITPAGPNASPFDLAADRFHPGFVDIIIQSTNGQDEQWGFLAIGA